MKRREKEVEVRVRNSKSPDFKKLNPQLFNGGGEDDDEHDLIEALNRKPPRRIRQPEKPLNKLEAEFFAQIKQWQRLIEVRAHSMRFRLGNGCWYEPDFTAIREYPEEREPVAFEVKGPVAWDDAIVKIKVAAAAYPEWSWVLVWKDASGRWQKQEVLP